MTAPPPIIGARLLFSLDPAVVHLNHGAFGAAPIPVQRAHQRLRDEMEANPMRFITRGLHDRLTHARGHLATFIGADPERTGLVANTTAGVAVVLNSIGWAAGDEVVTTDHGYGAVNLAIGRLVRHDGVRHVVAPVELEAGDDEVVAAILGKISGRTKLVIVDLITSPTARIMPVRKIAAALRATGVPLLVDGAHAPGAVSLAVGDIGADFFVGNLHKWAYAPRSTAVLVVSPEWLPKIRPLVVSWLDLEGFPKSVEFQNTLDYTGWLAAPTGVFVLRQLGVERVLEHNNALAEYGQWVVGRALGVEELPSPGGSLPMRTVPLPESLVLEAAVLRDVISDELRFDVSVSAWRGRLYLRMCAQVYNTADDYDRLAGALPGLLARLG